MGTVININRVDEDTGEYFDDRTYPGSYRVNVVSDKSIEAFKLLRDGTIDIHKGENYVKVYPARLEAVLSDGLSLNELRIFNACMVCAIKFKTGELVQENLAPITAEMLFKIAGVEIRRGYTALSQLISRGILAKERRGRGFAYLANPFIFVCGNSISKDLYARFVDTKWAKMKSEE